MIDQLPNIRRLPSLPWESVAGRLVSEELSLVEAASLLSEESGEHLEEMAQAAHALTTRRFGKTIKLYVPIYLSNACINDCAYCGFQRSQTSSRKTLSIAEVIAETEAVLKTGHRHLLLVSGEDPRALPLEKLEEIARTIRPMVASLGIEVQPYDEEAYRRLARAGIDGVTLYQETYDPETYRILHRSGPKREFGSRMRAIDAAGSAGMRFLGIGALLGLSDWRQEILSLIAHARWIIRQHWRSALTISIPRVRDCTSTFSPPCPVSNRTLAQIICALRLALPDVGIILSTRERAELREHLLPLGVTQMSCGSVTSPGGHQSPDGAEKQFAMEDLRTPAAFAAMLRSKGYDPVWKDWESDLV